MIEYRDNYNVAIGCFIGVLVATPGGLFTGWALALIVGALAFLWGCMFDVVWGWFTR